MKKSTTICLATASIFLISSIALSIAPQGLQDSLTPASYSASYSSSYLASDSIVSAVYNAVESAISLIVMPFLFLVTFLTLLSVKTYGLAVIFLVMLLAGMVLYTQLLITKRSNEVFSSPHKKILKELQSSCDYTSRCHLHYHKTKFYHNIGGITNFVPLSFMFASFFTMIFLMLGDFVHGRQADIPFTVYWAVMIPIDIFLDFFHLGTLENHDFKDLTAFITLGMVLVILSAILFFVNLIFTMKSGEYRVDIDNMSPNAVIDMIIDDVGDTDECLKTKMLLLKD